MAQQVELGNYIKDRTNPDDRILVIGSGIDAYILSDRLPSYKIFVYVTMNADLFFSEDAIQSLKDYNVPYVVITPLSLRDVVLNDQAIADVKLAPLYEYVYDNYELVEEFEGIDAKVYERRG